MPTTPAVVRFAKSLVAALAIAVPSARTLAAQTPPSVTVNPSPNTHTTSATFLVTMTACADNDMNAFQTITVNGTPYTALSSGGGGGSCGFSQSGGWGANVTLSLGSNSVTAQVCDVNNSCGSASTTIILDPVQHVTVTATPASFSVQTNTTGTTSFSVKNDGQANGTLDISVSCGTKLSCSLPAGFTSSRDRRRPIPEASR